MVVLLYREIVGEFASWRNTTLGHLRRPIHLAGAIHEQTVEMQSCGLIPELIVNIDNDLVPYSRCDDGGWPFPIDANGWSLILTIWVCSYPADREVIYHGSCFSDGE